jgi:hypothetical protein
MQTSGPHAPIHDASVTQYEPSGPLTETQTSRPYTPNYDTFVTQYAPSGPLPELAMSLSAQPGGPAPQSPRAAGALRGVRDVEMWFNEVVFSLEAERANKGIQTACSVD